MADDEQRGQQPIVRLRFLREIVNLLPQVLHDEGLPLRRVLAHVVLDHRVDVALRVEDHRLQPDVLADEALELLRGNLAQTFEPRNLRLLA